STAPHFSHETTPLICVPNSWRRSSIRRWSRSPRARSAAGGPVSSSEAASASAMARWTGVISWPCSQSWISSADVSRRIGSASGIRERGLWLLRHRGVPGPALVLQLDVLDGDGVGVGVEIGERLVLRNPAAVHEVGQDLLARLVEDVDDDFLAEVGQ